MRQLSAVSHQLSALCSWGDTLEVTLSRRHGTFILILRLIGILFLIPRMTCVTSCSRMVTSLPRANQSCMTGNLTGDG